MISTTTATSRGLGLILVTTALLAAAGCGRNSQIVLQQSFAPPSQQRLELASHEACFAVDDGRLRWLIGYQRPGSENGPCDYFLYGVMPDTDVAYVTDPGGGELRGFLLQEVGELAGHAEFESGRAWCHGVLWRSNQAKLDLRLRCADGTEIVGAARIRNNERILQAFERRHADEIERLGGALGSSRHAW